MGYIVEKTIRGNVSAGISVRLYFMSISPAAVSGIGTDITEEDINHSLLYPYNSVMSTENTVFA